MSARDRVLVIAEHDHRSLKPATLAALACALQLGEVHVLVAGHGCHAVAEMAGSVAGVTKVICCDDAQLSQPLAVMLAPLVEGIAASYSHVLAASTAFGKDLLPRVAARLDVAPISDVIAVVSTDTFKRPIYAGNAIATVQSRDPIRLLTVRTTAFEPVKVGAGGTAPIDTVPLPNLPGSTRLVGRELAGTGRPELTAARVVVAGGRGVGSAANFQLLDALAGRLDAAVGASRAAVDAGYAPNDWQVGQTGKVVAPDLYIAIGISGAIQHLAGMKDSKVIVAINKDPDAPVFQVADYGLVADLFTAVPELTRALD